MKLTPSSRAIGTVGASVSGVVPNSAADTLGLAQGDTITAVDGNQVTSPEGISVALANRHPGDKVAITWSDAQGVSHTAIATLGVGPNG